MQGHKIPNPFGAVTDHHLLECVAPAASPGFPIDSTTKLFRTLDGSGVGGGIGIADGIAFRIPRRLGEHASQLGFPSMGRVTFGLAKAEGQPAHTREDKLGVAFTQRTWNPHGHSIRDPHSTTNTRSIS